MHVITDYDLEENPQKRVFVRRNEQSAYCSYCQHALAVCGSRRRRVIDGGGEQRTLIIRRLYCQACRRVHHELPDLLVPYKRYDRESIESVIAGADLAQVAADESTLARWRAWFSKNRSLKTR